MVGMVYTILKEIKKGDKEEEEEEKEQEYDRF